ncbi:MAG: PAS domain S-box protein, partial [Burkholderiaceae bacterium]|nr:PAS domain S-box protein [Burkholderiaceae bacterium]
ARRLAAGDYSTRIERLHLDDEICRLAGTFNHMAGEVEARERRLSMLSQAIEQSPESIVITNLAGDIEYVNECFVKNTGYARDEAIGQNPRILKSGKTP